MKRTAFLTARMLLAWLCLLSFPTVGFGGWIIPSFDLRVIIQVQALSAQERALLSIFIDTRPIPLPGGATVALNENDSRFGFPRSATSESEAFWYIGEEFGAFGGKVSASSQSTNAVGAGITATMRAESDSNQNITTLSMNSETMFNPISNRNLLEGEIVRLFFQQLVRGPPDKSFYSSWVFDDLGLPGQTKARPIPNLPPTVIILPDDLGQRTLTTFLAPVTVAGDTLYFDPVLANGYVYSTEDGNRFNTFEIPDALPQGDDSFIISLNNIDYLLEAGQVFDFTTIDPLGVESFSLLGINDTELIFASDNSDPPFVFGMSFMQTGLTEFTTFALSDETPIIPEPSSIVLFGIGGIALLGYGWRRKRKQAA